MTRPIEKDLELQKPINTGDHINLDLSQSEPTAEKQQMGPPSFINRFLHNRNCVIGGVIILVFAFVAIFADFLSPYSPIVVNTSQNLLPPSPEHLLGTDFLGRDTFTRIIHGARISSFIAVSSIVIGLMVAIPVGMLSRYMGGKIDHVIVGILDILLAFPSLLLALVLVAILGVGLNNLVIAIGIHSIPVFTRLVRSATLSVKEFEYVDAARAVGENGLSIIGRYVFPNITPVIIVQATIRMGLAILTSAALGFIGLGVQPPLPEWGVMVADARIFIFTNPWLMIYPGIVILLFTLGFNLLGDGLNDLLNPKIRSI